MARYREKVELTAFESYVADGLKLITENTAKMGGGRMISSRFADILSPPPKDDRTAEEIISDVVQKSGIRIVRKGGDNGSV